MKRVAKSLGRGLLFGVISIGIGLGGATWSEAKNCTGPNCVCGDTIVISATLTLPPYVYCPGSVALNIGGNITVDFGGTTLVGSGGSCGIKYVGSNAHVKHVRITGYVDGVCNFSGTGNVFEGTSGNESWTYQNSHYGVHSTADHFTTQYAYVWNNGNEGIHYHCDGCNVVGVYTYDNHDEQIYYFEANGGYAIYNYIANGTTGIHLKDSHAVLLDHNVVENSPIHVRRNSDSNQISGNTLNNTFMKLQGEGSARPDQCWLTGNTITRNNTKIQYINPGIGNNIDTETLNGNGTDVTCSSFAGGGTNYFDGGPSDSYTNSGTCLTVY